MRIVSVILLVLFSSGVSYGQTISLSSPSLPFGHVQTIQHASYETGDFAIHYFTQPNMAISYSPVKIRFIKLGLIVFKDPFPTPIDVSVNFLVDAGFPFRGIRLSYRHISNGFGIRHRPNHGYDAITIQIPIWGQAGF